VVDAGLGATVVADALRWLFETGEPDPAEVAITIPRAASAATATIHPTGMNFLGVSLDTKILLR
jgi:hypothetical protein